MNNYKTLFAQYIASVAIGTIVGFTLSLVAMVIL